MKRKLLQQFLICENLRKPLSHVFGYSLSSPIGIAACPLTMDSKGIERAARLGYDVLTYKTIRSSYTPIKSPRMYYVDVKNQFTKSQIGQQFKMINHQPNSYDTLAMTNLFGIGSCDPDETIDDIKKTCAVLHEGQVLLVSIYGSGDDIEAQIKDFVTVASIAYSGGAHIIEANLSCPNLNKELTYKQPELVYAICKAITTALPYAPLIIKVGVFDTYEQTKDVIVAAYAAGARGICGINTMPVQIIDGEGEPVYGPERKLSGLSGAPIHALALDFVRDARKIIDEEEFDFILFATGGVTHAQAFDNLLAAGADIALCATGAMWNFNLALEYHASHKGRS